MVPNATKGEYFYKMDFLSLRVATCVDSVLISCIVTFLYVVLKKHLLYILLLFNTLQICAVKLQWKCIEKNCNFEKLQFILLTIVHCIFYKLKIVILALFSCSLFCIELNAHITSFHCF